MKTPIVVQGSHFREFWFLLIANRLLSFTSESSTLYPVDTLLTRSTLSRYPTSGAHCPHFALQPPDSAGLLTQRDRPNPNLASLDVETHARDPSVAIPRRLAPDVHYPVWGYSGALGLLIADPPVSPAVMPCALPSLRLQAYAPFHAQCQFRTNGSTYDTILLLRLHKPDFRPTPGVVTPSSQAQCLGVDRGILRQQHSSPSPDAHHAANRACGQATGCDNTPVRTAFEHATAHASLTAQ